MFDKLDLVLFFCRVACRSLELLSRSTPTALQAWITSSTSTPAVFSSIFTTHVPPASTSSSHSPPPVGLQGLAASAHCTPDFTEPLDIACNRCDIARRCPVVNVCDYLAGFFHFCLAVSHVMPCIPSSYRVHIWFGSLWEN